MKSRVSTAILLATGLFASPVLAADRPNVVFVYVDDMRADFLSSAGHPYIQTPNIDRLAAEGVTYTNSYVTTPLCGPSRATLMTGLLPTENNIRNHKDIKTHVAPQGYQVPDGPFLPYFIDDAGVNQAVIGKWHFGENTDPNPRPEIDRWFINLGTPPIDGLTDNQAYQLQAYTNRYYRDGYDKVLIEEYNTDLMFDVTLDFIANADTTSEPFYAYTSLFAPHAPFTPAPRHLYAYQGNGIPVTPNLDVASVPSNYGDMASRYERQAEMVLAIDEGVGRLYDALDQAGHLDDTIIVFASDNGFQFGEHGQFAKELPWEESIKVPLIVRWANHLQAGQVDDSLVSQADLGVTIADLLGAQLPEGLYGQSMASKWEQGEIMSDRDDLISIQYPINNPLEPIPAWASVIRKDGWKYVAVPDASVLDPATLGDFLEDLQPMLFNLNDDPYEMNNLAGNMDTAFIEAQLIQLLKQRLEENSGDTSWITVSFLAGDTDGDGDVDDSDLGALFANYTGPGATGMGFYDGDTDGDGDVDDSDMGTAFANYTGPLGPTDVPEPTAAIALLAGIGLCFRRRRA